MLNFDLLEKGLGIVPPPCFCMIFLEKCFSCYILLTDQILMAWLPLLLEVLANVYCSCLLTRLWHNKFCN